MNQYLRIFNILIEGITSGGNPELTGVRIGKFISGAKPGAKPGEKGYVRRRKLSIADFDAGFTDPLKAAISRKPTKGKKGGLLHRIAKRKAKEADADALASTERHRHHGAGAMDDLVHGIKRTQNLEHENRPEGHQASIPIKRHIDRRFPSGSMSQLDIHMKRGVKKGNKAFRRAKGGFLAGMQSGGVSLKPKGAVLAKRHSTQKTADELKAALRAEKHATSQAAGSTTQKVPSTLIRRRVKAVSRRRRERAQVYGDPKKGYADADKDPTMRNLMDFD